MPPIGLLAGAGFILTTRAEYSKSGTKSIGTNVGGGRRAAGPATIEMMSASTSTSTANIISQRAGAAGQILHA